VLVTTALGFFMAHSHIVSWSLLFFTLLGTFISSSGALALNNYLERDLDALMTRTRNRPLPAGEISPFEALCFGIVCVLLGVSLLVLKVNLLTGFLALLTSFLYVLVYTPLKRVTWLNTLVGAVPGALPPLGGWAAAAGEIGIGAWVLFLLMFIWQQPHFYSIAWMYREDYRQAGFQMLPSIEAENGDRTFRQIIFFSLALLPASLLPLFLGSAGWLYAFGAVVLGITMLKVVYLFDRSRSTEDARRLLKATVVYLPLLFFLIVADVQFFG
jgi:protoheme IX farnesyltransferase